MFVVEGQNVHVRSFGKVQEWHHQEHFIQKGLLFLHLQAWYFKTRMMCIIFDVEFASHSCLIWVAQVCSPKCCAAMCLWGPWVSVLLPWHSAMAISGKRCFIFWRWPFSRLFFGSLVIKMLIFFCLYLREGWSCHVSFSWPWTSFTYSTWSWLQNWKLDERWPGEILLFSNAVSCKKKQNETNLRGDDLCES